MSKPRDAVGPQQISQADPYPDPARFEAEIAAFEARDRQNHPPAGAIVCTGSSTMRKWHDRIREDLAPLTLIPRGFGGSNMRDAAHYADRIVVPYRPRAVVLYEGDNDIGKGADPGTVLRWFLAFVRKIRAPLPETRLYVLSIKPSVRRWALWPLMRQANALLIRECERDPRLTYVDVASPALDAAGNVLPDIFVDDQLHLNAKGYALWRAALRPVLLAGEVQYEAGAARGQPGHGSGK